jgi:hypothetical protein
MNNVRINLRIILPRIDYNLDYVDEIMKINNNEYNFLYSEDIKISTKHFPSAIDPGGIFVNITLKINDLMKEPVFANLEILNKLKKINDFIEYSKFKSVSIIYDYSTDEWRINNKCDNNMIED